MEHSNYHRQPVYKPSVKEEEFSTPKEASFTARTRRKEKLSHSHLKTGFAGRLNEIRPTALVSPSRPTAHYSATDVSTSRTQAERCGMHNTECNKTICSGVSENYRDSVGGSKEI